MDSASHLFSTYCTILELITLRKCTEQGQEQVLDPTEVGSPSLCVDLSACQGIGMALLNELGRSLPGGIESGWQWTLAVSGSQMGQRRVYTTATCSRHPSTLILLWFPCQTFSTLLFHSNLPWNFEWNQRRRHCMCSCPKSRCHCSLLSPKRYGG